MGRKSLYQVISGSGLPLAAQSIVAVRVRSTTFSWGPMSMLGKPGGSRSSVKRTDKRVHESSHLKSQCRLKFAYSKLLLVGMNTFTFDIFLQMWPSHFGTQRYKYYQYALCFKCLLGRRWKDVYFCFPWIVLKFIFRQIWMWHINVVITCLLYSKTLAILMSAYDYDA